MGKVNWRAASGGNITGGGSGKISLNTGIVSGSSNASRGGHMMNTNAGRTRAFQAGVNDVIYNPAYQAAADAAAQITNAAFKFQDRSDQMEADEALLAYKKSIRELYTGKADENGNVTGGYGTLQTKAAIDGYGDYEQGLQAAFDSALEGRSESVKGKMLLKMKLAQEAAINQGIAHHQQQFKAHEANLRAAEQQDILKDIEVNGTAAFTNGTVDLHLNKYDNPEERMAAQETLAQNTLFMTYNDSLEKASANLYDTTPAVTAYRDSVNAFEAIRSGLEEPVENKIQNWLKNQKNVAQAQAKANLKEQEEKLQNQIARSAPSHFATTVKNGNWGVLTQEIAGVRAAFKNTEKGYKLTMDSLKDGFEVAVNHMGGVTLADRTQYAYRQMSNLIANTEGLDEVEKMELRNFATDILPSRIEKAQDAEDKDAIAIAERMLLDGRNPGAAPTNMLVKNRNAYDKLVASYANKQKAERGPISGATQEKAVGMVGVFRAKLRRSEPLTEGQLDTIVAYTSDGLIDKGIYSELLKQSRGLEKGSAKAPAFTKTDAYKRVTKLIDQSGNFLADLDQVKNGGTPRKNQNFIEYKEQYDIAVSKVQNALFDAAKKAHSEGKEFDPFEWYKNYRTELVNDGSAVNVGFWSGMWDAVWESPSLESQGWHGASDNPATADGAYEDWAYFLLNGEERSIMEGYDE